VRCCQESQVDPEGELGGGDHSKSNRDRPTLACHGIYPVGLFENRITAIESSGRRVPRLVLTSGPKLSVRPMSR